MYLKQIFVLFTLFLTFSFVHAEKRLALVIGNSDYKRSPLRNPVNDARDMAKTLRQLNFQVIEKHNVTRKEMTQAIQTFGQRLQNNNVGLFYFSGHGTQVKGSNYLIPIGSNIQNEDEVPFESVNANRVLAKMESARNGLNILILDACRSNPYSRSFRSTNRGLARMDAPTGTFIAYATAPGKEASDGSRGNGLFTYHLLKHMKTTGLGIDDVMRRTRKDVLGESDDQTPWNSSSLLDKFCFSGCSQTLGQSSSFAQNSTKIDPYFDIKINPYTGDGVNQLYVPSQSSTNGVSIFSNLVNTSNRKGVVNYSNGSRYEGGLLNGEPHGEGKHIWNDGSIYEGEWTNGKENGKGKHTWESGGHYSGSFKDGKFHGQGVRDWKDGDVYKGEWKNGNRTGEGKFTWKSGGYSGSFKNGQFHGQGVCIWEDGDIYAGEWKNGRRNGKGVFTFKSGQVKRGAWKDDEFVE